MDVENISNQLKDKIIQILSTQIAETGVTQLTIWKNQCINFLTRARMLEQEYSKLRSIQVAITDSIALNYQEKKTDLKTENLVKEMYIFLNQVGETLRGETIKYQITLTTGKGSSQQMRTYQLSLEDFLNITQATHTRLTLKRTQTILNQLSQVESKEWTSQEIFDYQRFIYNAKRVQHGRWKKVNRGNLLEAYSRYQDLRRSGTHYGSTTIALQETLRGTQGFWQGADYQGFQIKGNAASIANIYTCINQINELYIILAQIDFNNKAILEKQLDNIDTIINDKLNNYIGMTTDKLLEKLIKQFSIK